ncbi:MAG: CRISPR-associated helicase Cas3' [Candidatus Bathyarchaeota archaeon]|nr:CRISPR-associated helicase Cas3' [Candidatus Bathyarchaeota archaeon]
MNFYAHPKGTLQDDLSRHLQSVAERCRLLAEGLPIRGDAFNAGLLHDIGKLNPFYQALFTGASTLTQLRSQYMQLHSVFSVHAAYSLGMPTPVLCAIAGHHGRMPPPHNIFHVKRDERFKRSLRGFMENLKAFAETQSFPFNLKQFKYTLPSLNYVNASNPTEEYLNYSILYSILLTADRGCFFQWELPKFSINIDTSKLIRSGSLTHLRSLFQKKVMEENSFSKRMLILKAPTGIGKTKLFLDIASKLCRLNNYRRIFYFSPLLALTEDFEDKLQLTVDDTDKILIYNHAFIGSLHEHEDESPVIPDSKEYFLRESFNYELIVSTTQRLLMTLYSDEAADKMKLAAFRDSMLIVDEVQLIPKFLLPNMVDMLSAVTGKLNAHVLFVSATVPYTLSSVEAVKTPVEVENEYLNATLKRIVQKPLDINELTCDSRTLVMVNTRRKALALYKKLASLSPVYITAGLTKKHRRQLVKSIRSGPVLAVATQVLEAGVDISFNHIYREAAPLDSIAQTLGRLNREAESNVTSELVIFTVDDDPAPYDSLEMKLSAKYLRQIHDTGDLYRLLPSYYRELSENHEVTRKRQRELDSYMRRLQFDKVWSLVKAAISADDAAIIVPPEHEWETCRENLLKGRCMKMLNEYSASIPKNTLKSNLHLFNPELAAKKLYMPQKQTLRQAYHGIIGADILIK